MIDDDDFFAKFDGKQWNVKWKWTGEAPTLTNTLGCYPASPQLRQDFEKEVNEWIQSGILVPVPSDIEVSSVVPLIAVDQPTKNKVRPVLDYRETNKHVSSHSGDSVVCNETIRKWQRVEENAVILDLKKHICNCMLIEICGSIKL